MTKKFRILVGRALASLGLGLLVTAVAAAQAVPPDPPSASSGTPSATRPGTSSGASTTSGRDSSTRPGSSATTTRSRPSDSTTTADSDRSSTRTTGSTTKSSSETERDDADDLRDTARDTAREGREEARDIRESTRDSADDFRDSARENQLETRGSSEAERDRSQNLRESARDTAREGREDARDVRRSAFEDADDFRDAARDSSRDARDADARSDDPDRDISVSQDREFDRDREIDRRADFDRREDGAEFDRRDSARSDVDVQNRTSAEFDRRDSDLRSDSRFSSGARVDSRRSDSRLSSDTRTSSEFRVNDIRSADVGLWFDRSTSDGLIINDIGTGAISRFGFREGDRIYSVNGVRVDSETDFVRTLFDPQWRGQRANVIIYRHGRPWTVYVQPQLLVQEYTTVAYDPLDDWGLVLDDRYDDHVVVWRVTPRSPAFYAGLRPGDVITTFQGRRISGRDDFVRLVGQGGLRDVALDISRNRQLRRVDLDLSGVGARTSSRTSLRPDFDAATGVRTDVDAGLRSGIDTGVRSDLDVRGRTGTGSRFDNTTIDGRLEGRVDNTLDRVQERDMFPNSTQGGMVPQGTLRGNAGGGARGTIQPGNVRPGVGGAIRSGGGILGGRRN